MKNTFVLALLSCAVAPSVFAQTSWGELEQRCWNSYQSKRTAVSRDLSRSQVDFSNLWNGQRVLSPFKVAFAVRGMGVAPAKVPVNNTGQHHLLVNQRLPANIQFFF